jgi:hypothetical protein
MNNLLIYVLAFIGGELVAAVVFYIVRKTLGKGQNKSATSLVIFRGILERLVLFVGLLNNYTSVLIVFGALKIGTRLHEDNKCLITNDYFLIGNLLTILIAMTVTVTVRFFIPS